MRKPVLTIFYQYDPWNASIGGIQTIISSCIKYAPEEIRLRFVGITNRADVRPGVWHQCTLKGRDVLFMPLFRLKEDNRRRWIPTTLRYTLALMRHNLSSDFMHFHRLEPGLAALHWGGEKTLFIHNDILSQVLGNKHKDKRYDNKAILWQRFPRLYLALESRLIRRFSQILSCNSESKAFYQKQYPDLAERVALIRNTVDSELFCPLPPPKLTQVHLDLCHRLNLAENTRFLLFAGRLHPQKDPLLLLQSFAELLRFSPEPLHLLMAGDGELKEAVQAQIQCLELQSKVSTLGALAQEDLIQLHQVSEVCLLTSRYEGLPLVVLEALACGTPVVTTRCGETPKLLSPQSGIVCEQSSPEAIATAIHQVLSHPEQYLPKSCVRDAIPYTASQVVGELYREILSRWKAKVQA